jgi:ABC-2 type transport system permease protein
MAAIQINRLSKHFGDVVAVDGLDHTVEDGEVSSLPAEFPDWVFLLTQVSRSTAYFTSIIALFPETAAELGVSASAGVDVQPAEAEPFYVTPEAGLVFLRLWLVVALVAGCVRFSRADL